MTMKMCLICTSLLAATMAFSTQAYADNQWPDLPFGFKDGISAQIGDRVFVGLGSAGKEFYMLDLNNVSRGWQKQAEFIGAPRSGATASAVGSYVYVFGGSGKTSDSDVSPVLFDSIFKYDSNSNTWKQIQSTSPVGLLGASSYSPDDKKIIFFGGYNKKYFDSYLHNISTTDQKTNPEAWQKIVNDYMGMKPVDYNWNQKVLSFDPQNQTWSVVGISPYFANCGAAIVAEGGEATLISGEIKPGLRTAEVKQFSYGQAQPWSSLHSLPAPEGSTIQEGVAGAFAGKSNGVTIVAGGANFHGAKAAFERGKMFAHEGLPKAFNPEMYIEKDGVWSRTNSLSEGLAYGASFTTTKGVLIAGGEKSNRSQSNKVYMLAWDGSKVSITD